MATVNLEYFYERRDLWIKIISVLVIVIIGLAELSLALGATAFLSINMKDKITALEAENEEKIKAWKEERDAFIEHYSYSGQLSGKYAKMVKVYDEKIKRIEYQNEGIRLLENQLSTP